MNTNVIKHLIEARDGYEDVHPYFHFEPWDVMGGYSPEVLDIAREYGIEFTSPELMEIIGSAPREFQTGYLYNESFVKVAFAGNQIGKSYVALMDCIVKLTGELPIAMRHDAGEDTRVKRAVTENNLKRYGRYDAATGEYLDHDIAHPRNDLVWDCGTIIGAGKYPKSKVAPYGAKIWIVTYKEARDQAWWPTLKGMIPKCLLDTTKGSRTEPGFDERDHVVHLVRGAKINFITYEQGPKRLEAAGDIQEFEKLVLVLFDEEPPDATYYNAVVQRVGEIGLVTTPYNGLSWTYDEIFLKAARSPDIKIYHATQYDCPYKTFAEVERKRRNMKKWEVGARIFGMHTEQSGRPYYEETYDQIGKHLREARPVFTKKAIYPTFPWNSPRELAIQRTEVQAVEVDGRESWEVYEEFNPEHTYFMSVDTAEGSADEAEEQDRHAAHLFRVPTGDEPDWPVQVATLDAGMDVDQFARLCLYGCAYYGNALLAPEALGKSAGIFLHETKEYPFRFSMVVTNDLTKKQTEKYGFFTSVANRTTLFDLVGSMMKDCAERPMFGLRNLKTLKQIAGTIVSKKGRPDHKKRRRNDALLSCAIGYYVYKVCGDQIHNHANDFESKERLDPWRTRRVEVQERRPVLGSSRGLDKRKNDKHPARRQR